MPPTNEELLHEIGIKTVQVKRLNKRIAELVAVREEIQKDSDRLAEIYQDRIAQLGKDIPAPSLVQTIPSEDECQ